MKKKFTQLQLYALVFLLPFHVSIPLRAQDNETVQIEKDKHGNIVFATFKPNSAGRRESLPGNLFLKKILNANDDIEFRLKKEKLEEGNVKHSTYQQYYKGLKVEHAVYMLHGRSEGVDVMNGNFAGVNLRSVQPSVTEQVALQAALEFYRRKKIQLGR